MYPVCRYVHVYVTACSNLCRTGFVTVFDMSTWSGHVAMLMFIKSLGPVLVTAEDSDCPKPLKAWNPRIKDGVGDWEPLPIAVFNDSIFFLGALLRSPKDIPEDHRTPVFSSFCRRYLDGFDVWEYDNDVDGVQDHGYVIVDPERNNTVIAYMKCA